MRWAWCSIGIGFRCFLDGVVYSISLSVSTRTGSLVALRMVLHEFPEGIVTFTLLIRGSFSERRSFALALLAGTVYLSLRQPDRSPVAGPRAEPASTASDAAKPGFTVRTEARRSTKFSWLLSAALRHLAISRSKSLRAF